MNINSASVRLKRVLSKGQIKHFARKLKPFKSPPKCRALVFFWDVYSIFHNNLREYFSLKKKQEIAV